jgi:hypothetical protein
VKTHFPDEFSVELNFTTNKVALCVRNPLDVLASQFSFLLTWTHSKSLKGVFHEEYKEAWERTVRYQIHKWAAFHRWWLAFAKENQVPIYFFRYEDLIAKDPSSTLKEFFCFGLE